MKYFNWLYILFIIGLFPLIGLANNVKILGDVRVLTTDIVDGKIATFEFSVSWDNSWHDELNYDAVYVFLKYKLKDSDNTWHHLFLMDGGHEVSENYGYQLAKNNPTANKNEGIFVFKTNREFGPSVTKLRLKWDITTNPDCPLTRKNFDAGKVYLSAMGIEMVYIPRGAFKVGDTYSKNSFAHRFVSIPEEWDLVTPSSKVQCAYPENPSYPASYAANHVNDIAPELRNAWCGHALNEVDKEQWWQIDLPAKKIVRYLAIESIPGRVPGKWLFQGANDLGYEDSWKTIYTGTASDWETSLVRTYPVTRTIKLPENTIGNYQHYRIYIEDMSPATQPPVIKNISMCAENLWGTMDNAVLINSSQTLLSEKAGMNGLYAPDGDRWDGVTTVDYPNGYGAFFTMKYELSQDQYVAFLNKLSLQQQMARTVGEPLLYLEPGAFIFGKTKDKASCRNGIVLSGKDKNSYVFACNLNGNDKFAEDGDGQTVACNFLSGNDMLAYADWSGLRPMTELEYEKMSRRLYMDTPFRGECAWNTATPTVPTRLENAGTRLEEVVGGNVNYKPANLKGPVSNGAFGFAASREGESGASYWGVMELSGNLREIYYNVNTEGRVFCGIGGEFHGSGKLNVNGNCQFPIQVWPKHMEALCLRGGSFADEAALLATSDRTWHFLPYGVEYRDSTASFRLGYTAPVLRTTSVLTSESGETTAEDHLLDVSSNGRDYFIVGDIPADMDGAYSIAWFVSENSGTSWDLIKGETSRDLRIRLPFDINDAKFDFLEYWYKRQIYSNGPDAETNHIAIKNKDKAKIKIRLHRDGYRMWDNGSYARSANEYRFPKAPYAYEGDTGDGVYRIDPDGINGLIEPYDVYCDMTTDGGGWMLCMTVTNKQGSYTDWWTNDASIRGHESNDDYFTNENCFGNYVTIVKENAKSPVFLNQKFDQMMLKEDYAGTTGVKGYELKAKNTMLGRFKRSNSATYANDAKGVIFTSGRMTAFYSYTLMWNYALNDDGARLSSIPAYNSATTGISPRVDGATNQLWQGNLTQWNNLAYNVNGAVQQNHTVWAFIREKPTSSSGVKQIPVLLHPGGYRIWADHNIAKSGYYYRYPESSSYVYSGDIGDAQYMIDPDGNGGVAAWTAYCDMSGGGWTRFDDIVSGWHGWPGDYADSYKVRVSNLSRFQVLGNVSTNQRLFNVQTANGKYNYSKCSLLNYNKGYWGAGPNSNNSNIVWGTLTVNIGKNWTRAMYYSRLQASYYSCNGLYFSQMWFQ